MAGVSTTTRDNNNKKVVCDLSDFDSVAAAAASVEQDLKKSSSKTNDPLKPQAQRLNYLVNNAGIHYGPALALGSKDISTKHGLDL